MKEGGKAREEDRRNEGGREVKRGGGEAGRTE